MNIICGTDFTRPARRAAEVAAAIAKKFSDQLTLVHCLTPEWEKSHENGLGADLKAQHRERLKAEAKNLSAEGIIVRSVMESGAADEVLTRLSRAPHTRLVVVSSLGHRSPQRWRLGGISERTAESAAVPTLVLRDPYPLLKWAAGSQPLRIFVAFDFSAPAESALAWVKSLCTAGGCEVTIGYCDWPTEAFYQFGVYGPATGVLNDETVEAMLETQIRHRAERWFGETPVKLSVRGSWGRPDYTLVQMAKEAGADLIVTGTHCYHGLARLWNGSVSRHLLEHAQQSVVCVPRAADQTEINPPKRVLVGTDFTEQGNRAVLQAAALSTRGSKLKVMHVAGAKSRSRLEKDLRGHSSVDDVLRERLRAILPENLEFRGVAAEVDIVEGENVADEISTAAERFDADLVCLGMRNFNGLRGSTATQVLRNTKRPVLILRSQT